MPFHKENLQLLVIEDNIGDFFAAAGLSRGRDQYGHDRGMQKTFSESKTTVKRQ